MSFDELFRDGVALLKELTSEGNLLVPVEVRFWQGQDSFGRVTFTPPVIFQAVVTQNARNIRMKDGQEVTSKSHIMFVEEIPHTMALPGQKRENPIDERDVITTPGGITGPILATSGVLDGGTQLPYYLEVFIGRSEQAQ